MIEEETICGHDDAEDIVTDFLGVRWCGKCYFSEVPTLKSTTKDPYDVASESLRRARTSKEFVKAAEECIRLLLEKMPNHET